MDRILRETPIEEYDLGMILRFTRNWIHYGFLGHTTLCVCIAAIKGLLGD